MRPDPPSARVLLHCCTMKPARSFASDNNAGIHPEGLKAISAANHGHAVGYGDDHLVHPLVISSTQATETGTVYKPHEIKSLTRFAHDHEMFLHMDGARIANAAAAQGQSLRQATRDLGVDVLSFGGTKNGLMG